ncbi:shikimate dehydrogenase [Rubrimonas cliftonensis]|uniref:Shikimate dehydrogenase (NADP(+)) n=1 Tax=Rubrimonas cliftonensis TaxID=89524 RepID=A0A1H3X7F8_9RHOB|nr:shikimate dehydrogenase [Rubrimonas cliftonensis]SDZ94564.1 shikimate dehydrogenase [Rubrimonas cliftonensis]
MSGLNGPVAGVLGWPVTHSRSPLVHGHWLRRYGLRGAYVALPTRPESLETAFRGLQALGFVGGNVTIPHKEAALALADAATPRARRIGAANMLLVRDGGIEADNSDGFGFIENLRAAAPGWRADAGPALVLGAGGAARAVVASLLDAGCGELRLVNRTRARAEALAEALGGPIRVLDWGEAAAAAGGAATLVNCTSLGMAGAAPFDLPLDDAAPGALATDIVYAPLRTPFIVAAERRGLATVDGLGMLLHQARPGFAAWFGAEPEVDEALRAAALAA